MHDFKKVLDHATRISYFDQLRDYEIAKQELYFKKISTWLYKFFRIITKTLIFLVNSIFIKKSSFYQNYQKYEWILVNDHSGHCEYFIDGIIKKFSKKDSILIISINTKLELNYDGIERKIIRFNNFTIFSYFDALKFCIEKKAIFKTLGIWKIPLFLNYVFENARAIQAMKFYEDIKLHTNSKLITLCDSHWHQSILTNEFNSRGLKTFTLIHGQPSEWHLLCPFISKYVLTWGNSMTKMVTQNCNDIKRDRIIQIGNTKHIENLSKFQKDDFHYNEINEIIFISPGFDSFGSYGLKGLQSEILKFSRLELPNFKLSIRPRPFNTEENFIRKVLLRNNLSEKIDVLSDVEFTQLVNKKRIFVGSISSAISDVFILNGLFIGLQENFPKNILETMMTFSPDIYFDIKGLEKYILSLSNKDNFKSYLSKISEIRDELLSPVTERIELYLDNATS